MQSFRKIWERHQGTPCWVDMEWPECLASCSMRNRYRNPLGSTWQWQTKTTVKNITSSNEMKVQTKKCHTFSVFLFYLISFPYTFKPVKTTTLRTTQKWLPWTGGRLIKHIYKMTTNQMRSFQAGFLFFSHGNICLNKDLQLRMFWCHSWRLKMF